MLELAEVAGHQGQQAMAESILIFRTHPPCSLRAVVAAEVDRVEDLVARLPAGSEQQSSVAVVAEVAHMDRLIKKAVAAVLRQAQGLMVAMAKMHQHPQAERLPLEAGMVAMAETMQLAMTDQPLEVQVVEVLQRRHFSQVVEGLQAASS